MTRYIPVVFLVCCSESAPLVPPTADLRVPSAVTSWVTLRDADGARLLEASARIVSEPGASAALSPALAARLIRFHVRLGDRVASGARVATVLMPEAVAAAGRLMAARTRLAAVGERQRGLEALAKEGFSRIADRIEVQTQMADATGEEQVAKATLAAAGIAIQNVEQLIADEGRVDLRAPFGGIVSDLDGDIGEQRSAGGKPFARIVDVSRILVEASFTQAIEPTTPATFVDSSGNRTEVEWANNALVADPTNGMFRAYFRLPKGHEWKVGTYGRVMVQSQQRWLVIPAGAVSTSNEVVTEAGSRVKIDIVTRSAAEVVFFSPSLHAGDKVAANPRMVAP